MGWDFNDWFVLAKIISAPHFPYPRYAQVNISLSKSGSLLLNYSIIDIYKDTKKNPTRLQVAGFHRGTIKN